MTNVGSAPPGPDANALERAIGGKLAVWVGAIALALGGVFLVKYSIDQGWIGPTARILSGLALGLGLGGAAWWLRDRSNYVAQGVAAAAVIDMYAVLWAAVELYALIPGWLALVGMVGTTLFAVALSLRIGPLVAILGLIGAFLAPLLIGGEPYPAGLFAYLLALQAGGQFLAYRRRWLWVSAISLGAGTLWVLTYVLGGVYHGSEALWPGLFLIGSTAVLALPEALKPSSSRGGALIVSCATLLGALLFALTLRISGFEPLIWALFLLLSIGAGALGIWQERFRLLPWMCFAITVVIAAVHFSSTDWSTTHLLLLLGALSLTFLGIGYAGLWRAKPREFAMLAGIAPLAFLMVAMPHLYKPVENLLGEYGWMYLLLTTGAAYALLALPVVLRRARLDAAALVALLVPAQLFIAAAWPFGFDLRVCVGIWSAQLVGAFALERSLRVAGLRGAGIALLIALQIMLLTPAVLLLTKEIGATPVLHWVTAAYAAAIAATLLARALLAAGNLRALLTIFALLLAVAGAWFNIRHGMHGGDVLATKLYTLEFAAYFSVLMLAALALLWRSPPQGAPAPSEAHTVGNFGGVLALLGLLLGGLMLCVLGNAWAMRESVQGVVVFNTILAAVGVPALLAGAVSWMLGARGRGVERAFGWWATGGLVLLLVTLQVRHAFHGAGMAHGPILQAENYAYSIAIAVLALVALGLGIARGVKTLRVLALIGMLACSLKVFTYDMRELEGIYRVLSFLGLGAGLMLLGYVYNRFRPTSPPRTEMPPPVPQTGPEEQVGFMEGQESLQAELPPRDEILTDS